MATDIEQNLVIRARDLASEQLTKLATTVSELSGRLGELTVQAQKGEGGTTGLSNALRDTGKVFDALFAQQSKLEAYTTAVGKLQSAQDRRDTAVTARDEFKDSIPANAKEGRTKDQKEALAALQSEVSKSESALRSANLEFKKTSDAITRIGVEAAAVPEAMQKIASAMLELSNASGKAEKAQENYSVAAKAAREATAAQKAELDKAAASLLAESNEQSRLAALSKSRAEQILAGRRQNYEDEQRAAREHFLLLEQYRAKDAESQARAAAEAKKQAQEAIELDRFRALAFTEASKTMQAASDARASSSGGAGGFSSLKDDLSAIVAPGEAARATITGLAQEVTSLGQAADNAKLRVNEASRIVSQLRVAQSALANQADLIDAFQRQDRAVTAASEQADKHGAKLAELGFKAKSMTAIDRELEAEIRKTSAAFDAATQKVEAERVKLGALSDALKKAKIDSADFTAATDQMTKTAENLAVALTKAGAVANQNKGGPTSFFGLQPYELTNLSYQVNDVFTQLASGTKITQVAAQQGGQFFQIFEKNIFSLLKYVALIGPSVAVLTPVFLGLQRAYENTATIREFNSRLQVTHDTGVTTGAEMAKLTNQIRGLGVGFDEAKQAAIIFLENGLRPDKMLTLAKDAQTLSDVFGIKFPEMAKLMAEAVTGDMDAVLALNKAIGFLTPELFKEIKDHYDAGEAAKAHEITLKALTGTVISLGNTAVGPTTLLMRDMRAAWNDFLNALANSSVIAGVIRVVRGLGNELITLHDIINRITGMSTNSMAPRILERAQADVDAKRKQIDEMKGAQGGEYAFLPGNSPAAIAAAQAELAMMEKRRDALAKRVADDKAAVTATDGVTSSTNAQATAAAILADQWKQEREARFDPKLRGPEAKAADDKVIEEFRKRLQDQVAKAKAEAKLLPEVQAELDREFKAKMDDFTRRQREQRAESEANQTRDPLGDFAARQNAKGLKGAAAGTAADRVLVDAEVENAALRAYRARSVASQTFEEFKAEKKNADAIQAAREAGYEAAARHRADQDSKGAGKALAAEESLMKKLLTLKEQLDKKDKTDLDAQMRAIEEKYQKFDIDIAKARRAGGRVAGIADEIDQLKNEEKLKEQLAVYEASINAKVKERHELNQSNNDLVKSGARSMADGYTESEKINKRLNQEMKELAAKALEFAKALGGANPTPAVQLAIAKFRAASEDSDKGGKEGVYGTLQAGLGRAENSAKTRDEVEKAERSLQKKGLQGVDDTEAKVKAAYDRTSQSIRNQTHLIQQQAAAALKNGEINIDQYELIIAKAKELQAETNYVSDAQKQLTKAIEDSVSTHAVEFFEKTAEAIGKMVLGQMKFGEVVKAVGIAFAQFVADVLKDIAKVIIKQLILAQISAIVAALTGGASTAGGAVVGAASGASSLASVGSSLSSVGGTVNHEGGLIGTYGGMRRQIPLAAYMDAPRFHSGGLVGLQPDEYPAILKKNEEVLKDNSPRNILNGGAAAGGEVTSNPVNLRQVLVFDPKDLSSAMAGKHGEQTVISHIRNNTATIRSLLR